MYLLLSFTRLKQQCLEFLHWSSKTYCLWRQLLGYHIEKMGRPRPLFVYFRSFQIKCLQKNGSYQRDLNSDRQSRRRARWPLDHLHILAKHLHLRWFWSLTLNIFLSSQSFNIFKFPTPILLATMGLPMLHPSIQPTACRSLQLNSKLYIAIQGKEVTVTLQWLWLSW